MNKTEHRLLLLNGDDNIVVLTKSVDAGEKLTVEGVKITLANAHTLGHKLARHAIKKGENILKYGAPIGRATQDIPKGAHVHTHNITSNYTKTHTLEAAQAEFGDEQ